MKSHVHRLRNVCYLIAAVSFLVAPLRTAAAQDLGAAPYRPDQVIVRVSDARPQELAFLEGVVGARGHQHLFEDDIWLLELESGSDVRAAAALLEEIPVVEYAHPNMLVRLCGVPDDPSFPLQWGFDQASDADIDAPEAWDLHTDASPITVAVIDTGTQYDHPDLAANMWVNADEIPGNGLDDDLNGYVDDLYGCDFVNDDGDPMDDNGHGTHTAGTIGAVTGNGTGVAGVCWRVQLMPLKIANQYGGIGDIADAVLAVEYSMHNGAHLSSNSWGGHIPYEDVRALEDAVHAAWESRGMAFVAAAGNSHNDNDTNPFYPASFNLPEVVAVAASDQNDDRASFSNYGRISVDLAAPGVDIYSTLLVDTYGYNSGTSMACPHVSGAMALMKALCPERDFLMIKQKIMDSVDVLPSWQGLVASNGRLNLRGALEGCECRITFKNGGVGLAGSGGYVPRIAGTEGGCAGLYAVHVTEGLGGTTGVLWVGTQRLTTPAFGGNFYIDLSAPWFALPIVLQGPPGAPGAGYLDFQGADLSGVLGLAVFLQATLLDPGAVQGVSLTGWLKLTVE
ncbi:MAG: S8 family peptidase [Planctomycetota bacterium]